MNEATSDTVKTDALIVGGGIIGMTCAYFLLDAGRTVRVLEAGSIGNGASSGNCGLVTPSHLVPLAVPGMVAKAVKWMLDRRSPFYVKPTLRPTMLRWLLRFASRCNDHDVRHAMKGRAALLISSRSLYESLLGTGGIDCEWEARGLLIVYKTASEMHAFDPMDDPIADLGVSCQRYAGGQLARLEPALRDDLYGARFYAMDAHLRPDRLLAEINRVIRSRGAKIEEQCPLEGLDVGRRGVEGVRTPRGTFEASRYILATGAWTPAVARSLGLKILIQPGKGYTITMARPTICPTYPCILKERNIAVTPWQSGYRLGGTMEFSGYDTHLNNGRIGAILDGARSYLREAVPAGDRECWYGWRPMTHDGLPFIGRSPRHANVIIAAGHGMLGVSMAPATGRLVAEIVTDTDPHIDPIPYGLAGRSR